jgi:polyhydroxybutyrate depolymerase
MTSPTPDRTPRVATLEEDHLRITVAGRERAVTIVGPQSPVAAAPAILYFHGSNQTAASGRAFTGGTFDALARRGVVVAYLDGHKRNWNDARASSAFAARRDGVDDVAFATATIDRLVGEYGVDRARIYAVGFSAGGALVIRLAHAIPALLAGAALIAATQPVPENFLLHDAPPAPLPLVAFHGTRDPLVPYGGGMASLWGFRPRGLGLSAPATADYFAARNGITTAPASRRVAPRAGAGRTTVERTDYRQDGHAPVTLFTIHGGGHVVPGPRRAPRIMGRSTDQLVAADAIAAFFGLGTPGS